MNELEKRAKYNKKHHKGKGWFVNPDAGDVEKNVAMFNHATGNTEASEANMSVSEDMDKEVLSETTNSRLYSHIVEDADWAIVSPYRSENSDEVNENLMTKLKSEVRKMNYGFIQFISRWVENGEGFDESSLLIPNMTKDTALKLGAEYKQSSVIIKSDEECKEICTTPFETYSEGDVVRTFNLTGNTVMNISDAKEIFAKRRGGPASMVKRTSGRNNIKPFHLSEILEVEQPRASYFQKSPSAKRVYGLPVKESSERGSTMDFKQKVELYKKACQFGTEGYKSGLKCAPAINKEFMQWLEGLGSTDHATNIRLLKEYNKGWNTANLNNWDWEAGKEKYSVDSGTKVDVTPIKTESKSDAKDSMSITEALTACKRVKHNNK